MPSRFRRDRRGALPYLLMGIVAIVIIVPLVLLSVVPLGGFAGWNVKVSVTFLEVSYVVGTYFSVTSVTGTTSGSSPAISWGNFLSNAPFAAVAEFAAKVCAGSHCTTLSSASLFPSVPFVNGQSLYATDTFSIGNVPSGSQGITVSLTQNGQVVATGSGSMCVNTGC